jgi:hypothetical protein
MKGVLKLLFVFALVVLVVASAYTFLALSYVAPQAVLLPMLSVCVLLAVRYIAKRDSAIFTKRFTTATGVG